MRFAIDAYKVKTKNMNIQQRIRKVVKGGYSLFVSLPMPWVKSLNILPGDKITPIILDNGDLLLKYVKKGTR